MDEIINIPRAPKKILYRRLRADTLSHEEAITEFDAIKQSDKALDKMVREWRDSHDRSTAQLWLIINGNGCGHKAAQTPVMERCSRFEPTNKLCLICTPARVQAGACFTQSSMDCAKCGTLNPVPGGDGSGFVTCSKCGATWWSEGEE